MKKYLLLTLLLLLTLPFAAQNSKKVKALQQQQSKLKTELQNAQTQLERTKKKVKQGQKNVDFLGLQLVNRLSHIKQLEQEMEKLEAEIVKLQRTITQVDADLRLRRQRLKAAIRYARAQKENNNPVMFILSAKTVGQMYRRARYAREYVSYQHALGAQIQQKQSELLDAQNVLLQSKTQKNAVLCEVMEQRKILNTQQLNEKKSVESLKKQQTAQQNKVTEQQKKLNALNKEIERQIAYEIEQARKRAEEEARKKAAAEAARKKAAGKSGTGKNTATTTTPPKAQPKSQSQTWHTAEDRALSGSFEQNKGRLPVPITGQYMLGSRFGIYNVPGMKNVQLDNKGTNFAGKPGARARSVFDGVVTTVFSFGGTKNVLVRHGSYISVYCNLSSVIVAKGQKVKTKDILGTVADDGTGNCTLHFQLRKETVKLNPESWIGR